MSQYKDIIARMAPEVKAGKPLVSSALTAYEDIDRVLTIFQIRKVTRLVPDADKQAAAKARGNIRQRLKPGKGKQGPAIKQDKGRSK